MFVSVQYTVFLYANFKEWRKNPHWSFSCCLVLLLPLNDLQGEIRGMVNADFLKNQLQTGKIDKPTILSAVKDSGAIDVTFEDGYNSAGNTVNINCQRSAEQSDTRRYQGRSQGTQTELCCVGIAELMAHGSIKLTTQTRNIRE